MGYLPCKVRCAEDVQQMNLVERARTSRSQAICFDAIVKKSGLELTRYQNEYIGM